MLLGAPTRCSAFVITPTSPPAAWQSLPAANQRAVRSGRVDGPRVPTQLLGEGRRGYTFSPARRLGEFHSPPPPAAAARCCLTFSAAASSIAGQLLSIQPPF